MNKVFDVFFHHQVIPKSVKGNVLYQKETPEALFMLCETIYQKQANEPWVLLREDEIYSKLNRSQDKMKYLEIQFFQVQLDETALLDVLKDLFPQFLWTKIVEEIEGEFSTYSCEFLPIVIDRENETVFFNFTESLKQMNQGEKRTVLISEQVEQRLVEILANENKLEHTAETAEIVPEPAEIAFDFTEEIVKEQEEFFIEEDSEAFEPLLEQAEAVIEERMEIETIKIEEETSDFGDLSELMEDVAGLVEEVEKKERKSAPKKVQPEVASEKQKPTVKIPKVNELIPEELESDILASIVAKEEVGRQVPFRSEESERLYLTESLKRERAAKERLRVAKEKLEHELVTMENNVLISGLKRFKKYRTQAVNEEDWYKPVYIDLIYYDNLYKKAKYMERSWRLNCELVTITEKMTFTKNELKYERQRIERVKNSVSEIDLSKMLEECYLIHGRVKIRRGLLFIKPIVKLYRVDYEQLEKISAFFDIIQTENRLLEQMLENV